MIGVELSDFFFLISKFWTPKQPWTSHDLIFASRLRKTGLNLKMDGQLVKMLTKKSGCVSRKQKLKHCTCFFQSSMVHSCCIQFGTVKLQLLNGWMLGFHCGILGKFGGWVVETSWNIYIYIFIEIWRSRQSISQPHKKPHTKKFLCRNP